MGDGSGAGADESVVGSPYWSEPVDGLRFALLHTDQGVSAVAPEVIEQNGATTASDIWYVSASNRVVDTVAWLSILLCLFRSVGCVVIELLEGQPPYHHLEPMQALFRIVQDDSPPIPEGASGVSSCVSFAI